MKKTLLSLACGVMLTFAGVAVAVSQTTNSNANCGCDPVDSYFCSCNGFSSFDYMFVSGSVDVKPENP